MYGLMNRAVEDLILERFGEDAWTAIKTRAGITEEIFLSMKMYPDAITHGLLDAASETLEVPADQLLETFGEYWTLYTASRGYGQIFQRTGHTFREFMLNLYGLHVEVLVGFPELLSPSFWCVEEGPSLLRLHYQSSRPGLAPMVVGAVRGLGTMFATETTVTHVVHSDGGADHDEFQVAFAPRPEPASS